MNITIPGTTANTITHAQLVNHPETDVRQVFRDKACSFDDVRIRQRIESDHAEAAMLRDFLKCLAVSHTVVPGGVRKT